MCATDARSSVIGGLSCLVIIVHLKNKNLLDPVTMTKIMCYLSRRATVPKEQANHRETHGKYVCVSGSSWKIEHKRNTKTT